MNIIEINKALIPYNFNIALGGELFDLRVDYNYTGEFFTIELSKNGETLCAGEPIIYGKPLFSDVRNSMFPKLNIIPLDPSDYYNAISFDNLCDNVLLVVEEIAGA